MMHLNAEVTVGLEKQVLAVTLSRVQLGQHLGRPALLHLFFMSLLSLLVLEPVVEQSQSLQLCVVTALHALLL